MRDVDVDEWMLTMMLLWKFRYLDRADKQLKDRSLYLDTKTLDPVTRIAVELVTEKLSPGRDRQIIQLRHLFHERDSESSLGDPHTWGGFQWVGPLEYLEDETGKEIAEQEVLKVVTGNRNVIRIPNGAGQHDIDLMLSEPKPIPVTDIFLPFDEIRVLGYFARDLQELSNSALMKDGPGSIGSTSTGDVPILKTAVTDDEIRSFVTIFRRHYMESEPASFEKAVAVYVKALGDHPYSKWVAGTLAEYESHLASPPDPHFLPFMHEANCTFTIKRLIDVFLYTQYAHQPDEKRQRQFNECLGQVHGQRSLLTWLFLTEIWRCSLMIGNAGRVITRWYKCYCDHHGVSPEVLTSLRDNHPGLGATEKRDARNARLFREKTEELALEFWKQHGRPEGGPTQFLLMAREQLTLMSGNDTAPQ